ncbi:DUF2384 domain-containing protein [Sphingomonas sp. R-74633]|nr:DUF2384 domain-containing protein [Sphingomonas sp. R-74633]
MQEPAAEGAPEKPARTSGFRKKYSEVRLSPESAERQGRIARIAFEALGREGATAFLNEQDDALGGRPLDLAIASAEGLAAVEKAIAARREAQ